MDDGFDADREMMLMMLDKGLIPSGNGSFVEVSAEAAETIKGEIEAGASFSSGQPEVVYGEPDSP
tara:strand:- start:29859 stop:30053 length:195 start_codon:yes stop_codon:yes gene_type:complete